MPFMCYLIIIVLIIRLIMLSDNIIIKLYKLHETWIDWMVMHCFDFGMVWVWTLVNPN